ncbi:MAG: chloride channel protein [Desulfurococcales archaeon]|nr:chloride channel protein [Desulfurococcales archaeon]
MLRSRITRNMLVMGMGWIILMAFITGILTGIVTIIFSLFLHYIEAIVLPWIGIPPFEPGKSINVFNAVEFVKQHFNPTRLLIAYLIGSAFSGYIVYKIAPETAGHGTDVTIKAIHHYWGAVRARVPAVKLFTSGIFVGMGGSAGTEGPLVQSGAGMGYLVAQRIKADKYLRRMFAIVGIGGAIGAVFRAPLGGSVFAIEVLYRKDYETSAFVPAIVTSITSYTVYSIYYGFKPLLPLGKIPIGPWDILFAILIGIFIVPFSIAFVKIFYWFEEGTPKYLPNLYQRILVGGVLAGVTAFIITKIDPLSALGLVSRGYLAVEVASKMGSIPLTTLFLIAVGKILTTSMGVGMGNSGGVFSPMIVIGSSVGLLLGEIMQSLGMHLAGPTFFIVVGMSAMIAATAKVPLTAIVMTSDMMGSNWMIPASAIGAVIAYALSGTKYTIYGSQLTDRSRSVASRGSIHF